MSPNDLRASRRPTVGLQLLAGYAVAVGATLAVAAVAWVQLSAMERDLREITEEWEELDSLGAALGALRRARASGDRSGLAPSAAILERMIGASRERSARHGPEHEERELRIWTELHGILRAAEAAGPAALEGLEETAAGLSLVFWEEDRGRVPRRLEKLERRELRLRKVNVAAAAGLVLLPLVFLLYLQLRIARPLARIQRRVESIAGPDAAAPARGSRMERLADAIAAMAESIEARQRELKERLRHADRLGGMGRISAAVAHELNTPLGSIGLCVEGLRSALAESPLPLDRIERYLRTAAEQLDACTATTRKLLSYARLRPQEAAEIAADTLAREAVDLVTSHVRKSGVEVEVEGAAGEEVRGDPAQLRQAIVNLLLNALDASPRGGRVRVLLSAPGRDVEIRVRDEGPGVPPELREEIFNPFFTTKRPGEGTGLGLSIAREIVEAHGGTLALEDGGPGASFLIRLPQARMVRP